MDSAAIIRRLVRDGWYRVRVSGSHHHYAHHAKPGVVTVPDLPGCTSAGDTLGDAINNAAEAIRGHVQTLIEIGQPVGLPSAGAPVDLPAGHLVGVVDVDLESDAPPLRAVRLNVSIPATALVIIDAAAKITGTTRSAFLTRAALTYIERVTART